MLKLERYVWAAQDKGNAEIQDVLSNPSQAELSKKAFDKRKATMKEKKAQNILDKYGGQEHLNIPNPELLRAGIHLPL